jgi:hypothetical protein
MATRPDWRFLRLALSLCAVCGCQALHRYRPVAIQAVDAETGRPVPGADIRITYPVTASSATPAPSHGTTATDGIARLQAAPCAEGGAVHVEASAPGYLGEETFLSSVSLQAISPAKPFEKVEHRPATLVVALYASPDPKVEMVIPTGFRGMVKAELKFSPDAPGSPGQRTFRYEVPASGVVQVNGPPLLRRLLPAEFHGSYADGTELKPDAADAQIGFWWLRHEELYDYFFVGTRSEYELHRPAEERPRAEGRSGGGSKGGGRGRRNHGGAPAGGDDASAGAAQ